MTPSKPSSGEERSSTPRAPPTARLRRALQRRRRAGSRCGESWPQPGTDARSPASSFRRDRGRGDREKREDRHPREARAEARPPRSARRAAAASATRSRSGRCSALPLPAPPSSEPASSATAVKPSPLSATVTTVPMPIATTASADPLAAPTPSSSIVAADATATIRIGPSRLPSEVRPSAGGDPSDRAADQLKDEQQPPGRRRAHPRCVTRNSRANAEMANCGTTSSALDAWSRHNVEVGMAIPAGCPARPHCVAGQPRNAGPAG